MTDRSFPAQTAHGLMTADVVTVSVETSSVDLAHLLLRHQVGGAPVLDSAGALIGMVSGFDVISKTGSTVGEIMSRGVVFVDATDDLSAVISLMGLHGIRRVPVCREGKLVGIISRSDLLRNHVRNNSENSG